MPSPSFSLAKRLQSFSHAFAGLRHMLVSQHNAWIHLVVSLAVVGLGIYLKISAGDWRWLVVAIAIVWTAETMNTAFEFLCDVASPEFNPAVKNAKDIAAGAVLICAVAAAMLGGLVFWPYL